MQIRLTVVDPLGPPSEPWARTASCDVVVTAPAGTALATVASALASVVAGDGGSSLPERGRERESGGAVVLYAGDQRLDTQRCTLGEPPLVDGAVLALGTPAEPEPHPEADEVAAQLHVVAGPDAGGVHLLHGGQITIGRSADADVPLDDPDVSRLHCAVTVSEDGRIAVADLDSTNGTTLSGARLGTRPVRLPPGALLRIGESALRLTPPGHAGARVDTTPDGEGHVRVSVPEGHAKAPARTTGTPENPESVSNPGTRGAFPGTSASTTTSTSDSAHARVQPGGTAEPPSAETHHAYGSASWGAAGGVSEAAQPVVPGQGRAPRIENRGSTGAAGASGGAGDTHGAGLSLPESMSGAVAVPRARAHDEADRADREDTVGTPDAEASAGSGRKGTPLRGTDVPQGGRKRGGLSKWARRLTGGRTEQEPAGSEAYDDEDPVSDQAAPEFAEAPAQAPESWPDPATLLLTALGPGPRLWERGPGHPETLTLRLGTADRAAPDGSGLLPAVPVTAGLREVGALGLAGPRARLSGLARAVVAQLTALHSPEALEIVLISTDRSRTVEERTAEWAWLGWLPHLRPGHGQDCRLLLAYDREQATARADELLRRLEDHDAEAAAKSPAGRAETGGEPDAGAPGDREAARRPSWARDDEPAESANGFTGPYTVVVVDGDPGGAAVREAVARLAQEGPRAGIHVLCLAETEAASPASPVAETYEAACAASPPFRECGAVALLSGDVATALHVMRVARTGANPPGRSGSADMDTPGSGSPSSAGLVGQGSVAAVDAVSLPWAERFARALAPLRTDGAAGARQQRVSAPLPQAARLLDELGLARATPASLMARWADAADDKETLGGRAWAVLGAGPRGPVGVDLAAEGPHLLIEGPPGSGRTELLRAVVASLAAAERPDRLGIVLMDGRDGTGGSGGSGGGGAQHGEGLRVCTDLPHVTTHLTANDPVRMREFAQSLSAELKRRAELLGRVGFAEWHTGRELSGRIGPQRSASGARSGSGAGSGKHGSGTGSGASTAVRAELSGGGAGDLDTAPSSTLRLRPAASRRRTETPPLARLVVVVDDLDALVSPALGSPGRPSAGSVVRALEAVAREGERLGVHLVAAAGVGGRTAETELARGAALRVLLDAPAPGPDEPAAGRGRLSGADGRGIPFQGGRVTGRIPRTATLRPTVAALDWQRMGDPPARRPVRELGNGPTDLALLASALERAARSVSATEVPSLL
ncbi:FHA domain-containing protein [Streptomyces sp. WI04-05B]|uniref:FHA domain-containing protein n=1 Tax=Streptomyces TaxID=1883 RepID=UPI0029A66312|nr:MULTISPECIES: FHA domain-containing protein [unclassified Streptomyces]MDX2547865.1 FHA domain-containing protein [Streptomyces sp. WI04-05B]MDX2584446.1 FHA domain-containing protein [Streptomyces sp. WI04-05A]